MPVDDRHQVEPSPLYISAQRAEFWVSYLAAAPNVLVGSKASIVANQQNGVVTAKVPHCSVC